MVAENDEQSVIFALEKLGQSHHGPEVVATESVSALQSEAATLRAENEAQLQVIDGLKVKASVPKEGVNSRAYVQAQIRDLEQKVSGQGRVLGDPQSPSTPETPNVDSSPVSHQDLVSLRTASATMDKLRAQNRELLHSKGSLEAEVLVDWALSCVMCAEYKSHSAPVSLVFSTFHCRCLAMASCGKTTLCCRRITLEWRRPSRQHSSSMQKLQRIPKFVVRPRTRVLPRWHSFVCNCRS